MEGFLIRFRACREYNQWSDEESLEWLVNSLQGGAEDLLWVFGPQPHLTWQELVQRLKNRFGRQKQVDLYRSQLKNCRQERGEDLLSLGNRIIGLMHWAYPEARGSVYEGEIQHAFIRSITNPRLQRKVAELEVSSFDELVRRGARLEQINVYLWSMATGAVLDDGSTAASYQVEVDRWMEDH